jgi:D-alanyl-D-alanine carboxypeptidase
MTRKKQTKKIIRIALFTGTIISMFFVPWILIRAWLTPLPDTVQGVVNEGPRLGFQGIVVYVGQAGSNPKFYAAGWKNTEKKIPADPHALFKIASIGKLYVAAAITKLVYDNKLSLDGTLADYFPELVGHVQYAKQITLRMMVQHRSGIPNLTSTPNFWTNPPKSYKDALHRILDQSADFKPGEKYAYSNTNYLLISELIKRVSGKSSFQYIKEKILKPLGLKHTFGSIHDVNMDDLMSGYYVGVDHDIKSVYYGSMVATAEDVGKFVMALNKGTLLNPKEQAIYSSIYKYSHTGLIPGYQSIAKYFKDLDVVVVQFTNTTDFEGYNWNLSEIIYNRMIKILRKKAHNCQIP